MRKLVLVISFIALPAQADKGFDVCWDMGKLTEKYVSARQKQIELPRFSDGRWTPNVQVIGNWAFNYAKTTTNKPDDAGQYVYKTCMKHFKAASYGDAIGRNFSKDSIER